MNCLNRSRSFLTSAYHVFLSPMDRPSHPHFLASVRDSTNSRLPLPQDHPNPGAAVSHSRGLQKRAAQPRPHILGWESRHLRRVSHVKAANSVSRRLREHPHPRDLASLGNHCRYQTPFSLVPRLEITLICSPFLISGSHIPQVAGFTTSSGNNHSAELACRAAGPRPTVVAAAICSIEFDQLPVRGVR